MTTTLKRCAFLFTILVPALAFGETIADSSAEFTSDGSHGGNGWSNGYYDQTADADGTYSASDFTPFEGPDWVWTGSAWDWGSGNVPWTTVAADNGHPNGDNNGDVHWAMRRWESDHTGPVEITWNLAKQNVNCGNGTTGILFLNGNEISSATIEGADGTGVSHTVMADIAAGDTVDLALSPLGVDGTLADGCDGSFFGATVTAVPEPGSFVLLLMGMAALARRRR